VFTHKLLTYLGPSPRQLADEQLYQQSEIKYTARTVPRLPVVDVVTYRYAGHTVLVPTRIATIVVIVVHHRAGSTLLQNGRAARPSIADPRSALGCGSRWRRS
jgi:hypothetical protein